ncbi:MAG: nicotinate-nucleotide adenylyltransferase [Hydrogenibacillus schlegelii]|uniref:Probable nicotinate-nucleotide adenylyltransferase n=1 Tax=Hydrogenibacillus schlegelii TaxID=1484 RepID=A0A947D0Z3_HYDSH|nr:nicotinate-nucleotide adenylyltransferase [Hydrogenibacillus schlegelii]
MRRIGLFGGTFDPPHWGHLVAAERAADALGLEAVWFVPNRLPPHKDPRLHAPAEDRLAMVRLAIEGVPRFAVSTVELERDGPSYTIDTVRLLRARHPDVAWTFIVGEDAFRSLPTWKEAAELVRLVDWAVLRRFDDGEGRADRPADPDGKREALGEAEPPLDGDWPAFSGPIAATVVEMPRIDLSSSLIRTWVRAGRSIRFLVPEPVRRYIVERGLYREPAPESVSDRGRPARSHEL